MDKVNTKSLIERMRDHLACYWKEGDVAPQVTSIELMLIEEAADELAAQKEQYRVLTDEMLVMMDERNEAEKALRVAVGLLSTMPQFSNMHPNDVLECILKETREMK